MQFSNYIKFSYRKRQFLNERNADIIINSLPRSNYIKYVNTCKYDISLLLDNFIIYGNLSMIHFMVRSIQINYSTIIVAIYNNHFPIIKYLTEDNISIKLIRTFIWLAAKYGHLSIIKILIKNNYDFMIYALRSAIDVDDVSIVKYLVKHGADISIFDNIALDIMTENCCYRVVKYLKRRKNII